VPTWRQRQRLEHHPVEVVHDARVEAIDIHRCLFCRFRRSARIAIDSNDSEEARYLLLASSVGQPRPEETT
jgi:hypothetical protein